MGLFLRKARRDLARQRGPFVALTLMTALGVAALTSVYGSYNNLSAAIEDVYQEQGFHDLRVTFSPRPAAALEFLDASATVTRWDSRTTFDAPATFIGEQAPIMARVISVPDEGSPSIDVLALDAGRWPIPGVSELLVETGFAQHHRVGPGDEVLLTGASGATRFVIVGVVTSPEYLWPAKTAVEHMPDVLRRWGVLYVPDQAIASLAAANGTVNEVVLVLRPGADPVKVFEEISIGLGPQSVAQVETRQTQASDVTIDLLVGSLAQIAIILPVLFLLVVGLSTYVLLTRFVTAQRANIGLLRALGYGSRTVYAHFLTYAPIVAVIGSALGFLVGHLLSFYVTDVFKTSVSLADVPVQLQPPLLAVGLAMSLAFTVLAALLPARRAARLRPAEAMRPATPKWTRKRWIEMLLWPTRFTPPSVRMATRSVLRNPRRSIFTLLGLALAVAVVVAPVGLLDSLDVITERSVSEVQLFDDLAVLSQPVPADRILNLSASQGIGVAEPLVQLQRSIARANEILDVTIIGMRPENELYRLQTAEGERLRVRSGEVVLSRVFASHGFAVGDGLEFFGQSLRVQGFVRAVGLTAFVPLDQAQAWAQMPGSATVMVVDYGPGTSIDAGRAAASKEVPIAAFQSLEEATQDARAMLRLFYGFVGIIIVFGLAIGASIVFNTVTINVLESSRDYSSMRTFGTPMRRVAGIITSETLMLAIPGCILGLALGNLLAQYLVSVYTSDLFVLELAIRPGTYGFGAVAGLVVALLSEVPSVLQVAHTNLAMTVRERFSG